MFKKHQDNWIQELAEAMMVIESVEEGINFLRDILDDQDLERVPKRWQVILHLLEGKTHRAVRNLTGASNYMISRASRMVLQRGTGTSKNIYTKLKDQKAQKPESD